MGHYHVFFGRLSLRSKFQVLYVYQLQVPRTSEIKLVLMRPDFPVRSETVHTTVSNGPEVKEHLLRWKDDSRS